MTRYVDARSLEPGAAIDTDICIVGAGAAGVTLAVHLADAGFKVTLLEAGGLSPDANTQSLYEARQTGLRYYDMTACRLRYFGGTTNHWSGYCRENDPIDYEGRAELNVPAWPLRYADIAPYVEQAARLLGFDPAGFDPALAAAKHGVAASDLPDRHSPDFVTKVFQVARRRKIHEIHADRLAAQRNLDVVLNANVTAIRLWPDGRRVKALQVRAFGSPEFNVRAKRYVLAAHAVENARLLLASNDVLPAGIGNQFDHVGRYFMEHPYIISGVMVPTPRFPHLYDYHWALSRGINCNLSLSAAAMRREGMLQYYCRFTPVYGYEQIDKAAARLKDGFWSPADRATLESLGQILGDVPNTLRYLRARVSGRPAPPLAYRLDHRIEQAPNPECRVTLANERDALGVPRAVFNWQLNEVDFATFGRGHALVVRELTRLQMGRFDAPPLTPQLIRSQVRGHNHHIGTTRMSDDPRGGVVDRHGRVHGVQNLYVAGSGVFPSAGYSGPTMMIIAFAIRLAEHLKESRQSS